MKTLLSSLLLLSLVPSAAHALSCADGPYASVPKDGSAEVPLNARVAVWYSFSTPDELPLHLINNATGEEVPTSTSDIEDSGGVFLLVPDSPLDTDTSYSVTVTRGVSTVRRSGPLPASTPTGFSCCAAPIPTPRSIAASRSSCARWSSPGSRSGRSR